MCIYNLYIGCLYVYIVNVYKLQHVYKVLNVKIMSMYVFDMYVCMYVCMYVYVYIYT